MTSGVFKFSEILKLKSVNSDFEKGFIVDTSVLFAVSYPNDAHNTEASELFEYLRELQIPSITNVNIRAEFIQNQFQVLVPEGLNDMYAEYGKKLKEPLYKKLQTNFTLINEAKNKGTSYKFSNAKISEWRNFLREHSAPTKDAWFDFCQSFINNRIEESWEDTCSEIGVNFLSLRGSDTKDWMTGPIEWKAASSLVGNYGIGSFDAMIINLFLNSHFPALVTADKEIARTVQNLKPEGKFVFVPDKLDL